MPRTITLGAAQTGPVNEDDWRPNVRGACAMIEEAGRRKVDILSFSELFLTPFFPNRLTRDFDKFFVTLEEPELQPIFKAAIDNRCTAATVSAGRSAGITVCDPSSRYLAS